MTVDDASGTVTICRGQGLFLRADDAGVLVRNFPFGRARRIAWSEISHFADGRYTKEGSTGWQLDIILRTGKRVPVPCSVLEPTGETLAAVRQVAERYGIPADLAGSPAKNGRPAVDGLYEDPGGQGGLRYWHYRQWSPLLPPDVGQQRTVRKSHGSWSALPTAEGRWTGAATLAMRSAVLSAVIAVTSAALLAWGLLAELGWYRLVHPSAHAGVEAGLSAYVFAALFALGARGQWRARKFFLKLDEAANGSISQRHSPATRRAGQTRRKPGRHSSRG